jgi:HEAT repeat protein
MAAKGLDPLQDAAAVETLIAVLDDENPYVRRMAEQVLSNSAGSLPVTISARIESAIEMRRRS